MSDGDRREITGASLIQEMGNRSAVVHVAEGAQEVIAKTLAKEDDNLKRWRNYMPDAWQVINDLNAASYGVVHFAAAERPPFTYDESE